MSTPHEKKWMEHLHTGVEMLQLETLLGNIIERETGKTGVTPRDVPDFRFARRDIAEILQRFRIPVYATAAAINECVENGFFVANEGNTFCATTQLLSCFQLLHEQAEEPAVEGRKDE